MRRRSWTGKSYGGYWGNWCFVQLLKVGMYPAYFLLVFVALYFLIFRRKVCAGAAEFLSRVEGRRVSPISLEMYKLIFSFGVCLLDRVARFSGSGKIKIEDECADNIREILSEGRGLVVLTAHVGGWEMSGAELLKYGKKVFVLGTDTENGEIRRLSESARKVATASVSADGNSAYGNIEAYATLKKGGIVALHADRYAGGRFALAKFLGSDVRAPTAAYSLAKAANAPILQTVCFREKLFFYRMENFPPIDACKKTAEDCAAEFMRNLESSVRKHKYQWFNFYDFWE